ncbi:MAG: 30S ribosomal protein S3 [Clostridiales bacterium]|nr:30S ribosomal protein S3 [Clostridiales bacterium]
MGQKVNPHGLRVGVNKGWDTRWYADKNTFSEYLVEDKKIRDYVKKELYNAGVTNIEIERKGSDKTMIIVNAAKPGIIIGRQGAGIEDFKKKLFAKFKKNFFVDIREVKSPDMAAQLVAESIAAQLERRISFRRAMKQAMMRTMKAGAKGIKTQVSGRLNGAEIARVEHYHEGTIPLQTLRADIDYGFSEANTTYGRIGVKVWVYRGEILTAKKRAVITEEGGES